MEHKAYFPLHLYQALIDGDGAAAIGKFVYWSFLLGMMTLSGHRHICQPGPERKESFPQLQILVFLELTFVNLVGL